METKRCSKCQRELPADLTHFFSNGNTKSGLSSQCKECMGCRFKESAYSGITNPNEEKKCTACKRIFPKTSEYFQKANDGYLHPKCRECSSIEYAAKQGKAGILTNVQFKALKKYFGGGCAYCESRMKVLYKDLIIPEYLGGKPEKGNVIPVCMSCRNSRNDANLEEWFRKQLFFTEEKLKKIYGVQGNETKPKEVKTMNFEEITKKYQESANKGHCIRTLAAENGVFKSDIICELFKSGYQYLELKRAFPSDYAAALKKFEKWTKGEAQEPVTAEPEKEEPVKEEAPEQEEEAGFTDEEIGEALKAAERHDAEKIKEIIDSKTKEEKTPLEEFIETAAKHLKVDGDELKRTIKAYQESEKALIGRSDDWLEEENTKLDEENIKLTQENSALTQEIERLKKTIKELEDSTGARDDQWYALKKEHEHLKGMLGHMTEELEKTRKDRNEAQAEAKAEKKKRKKIEKAMLKFVTR